MLRRSAEYYELMNRRRTVRTFSEKRVPREVIENIIKTAGLELAIFFCNDLMSILIHNLKIMNVHDTTAESGGWGGGWAEGNLGAEGHHQGISKNPSVMCF